MTRISSHRSTLLNLVRAVPFRPFAFVMENGDRLVLEHPENVAFDARENGLDDVLILSDRLKIFTTFSAITSIAQLDTAEIA